MIDFFRRLFGHSGSSSAAKERLRLVLMTDHLELSPEIVDSMKRDLMEVISRYVEVDRDKIDVSFERQDNALAMLANIPILAVNRNGNGRSTAQVAAQQSGAPIAETQTAAEPIAKTQTAAEPAATSTQPPPADDAGLEPAVASKPDGSNVEDAAAATDIKRRRRRRKRKAASAANATQPAPAS